MKKSWFEEFSDRSMVVKVFVYVFGEYFMFKVMVVGLFLLVGCGDEEFGEFVVEFVE